MFSHNGLNNFFFATFISVGSDRTYIVNDVHNTLFCFFVCVFPQSELPDLTEEQLLSLLDECDDPAEGCSQNLEKWGM